ncbi:hypothetical protein [Tahibacter caeni]|uniref:hypothetical protein n=1 Tax=Tahibacter caeni TaxID=1453545 RepID=UPI002148C7C0|nr:hypothetical protein [Tahibacter caeni]
MQFRTTAILLLAALPAFAHDPLPDVDWCAGGRVAPKEEFRLGSPDLDRYRICLKQLGGRKSAGTDEPPACPTSIGPVPTKPCPNQTCGEFDDDYHVAQRMALNHCRRLYSASTSLQSTAGSVVAIIEGPASILDTSHHSDYSLSEGVSGFCAVCEASPEHPAD